MSKYIIVLALRKTFYYHSSLDCACSSNLSAKSSADAIANGNIIHLSIRRVSKDTWAVGARGRTMLIQAHGVGKGKAVWTERVAIDLAEIETDAIVRSVDSILKLEDWLGYLACHTADLDAAPIIGEWDVSFMESAGVRSDSGNASATGGCTAMALAANVNVDREAALVADVGATTGGGCGVS